MFYTEEFRHGKFKHVVRRHLKSNDNDNECSNIRGKISCVCCTQKKKQDKSHTHIYIGGIVNADSSSHSLHHWVTKVFFSFSRVSLSIICFS